MFRNFITLANSRLQGGSGIPINKLWSRNSFCCSRLSSLTIQDAQEQHRAISSLTSGSKDREGILQIIGPLTATPARSVMTIPKMPSCADLVEKMPASVQPYMRLARFDKPSGSLLLFIPCAYSIIIATPFGQFPSFYYLSLFGVGSILMRSAGCVINDLWDKDLDKHVERTKDRPLASGELTPRQAITCLAGLLTSSLGILLSLNTTCIAIGVASMLPVIAYPLAKRYVPMPQLVLGLTFNVGAIMGYTAVTGELNLPLTFLLYASSIFWTLHYDTIYCLQDLKDDKKAGINSIARWFLEDNDKDPRRTIAERIDNGVSSDKRMWAFILATQFAHLTLLGGTAMMQDLPNSFNAPLIAVMGWSFYKTVEMKSAMTGPPRYGEYFNSMRYIGAIICFFMIMEIYRKPVRDGRQLVYV